MINFKIVSISAISGFILSFLVALFSGISFVIILLRALGFGLVFGSIAMLIQFLSAKFLSVDSSFKIQSAQPDSKENEPHLGNKVNITIPAEDLSEDSDGPQFIINNDFKMIKDGDVENYAESKTSSVNEDEKVPSKDATSSDSETKIENIKAQNREATNVSSNAEKENTGFKPISLGNVFNHLKKSDEGESENIESSSGDASSNESDELDELPDIEELTSSQRSSNGDSFIQNSDFAENGAVSASSSHITDGLSGGKDTTLMAEAIRTILTKEK